MRARIARKLYAMFQDAPRGMTGYSLDQIRRAHAALGHEVDQDKLSNWREAAAIANAPPAPRVRAPRVPKLPQETTVKVGAVEAKIEAGPDQVLGTADDQVTLQRSFDGVTVPDLKKMAKGEGIKGYSKMKRDEIIAELRKAQ